jgi:endosialidase-like protein
MGRFIRFLGVLPLLFVSSPAPLQLIPEPHEIPNWPAPPYWTPPAVRAPGALRTQAISTTSAPLPFIAITPCRQYDSRNSTPLPNGLSRPVELSGAPCGVPASAVAFSVNITVFNISATANGVFEVGASTDPTFAWINFPPTETQRGNAGALPVDDSDQLWVRVQMGSGQLDFVIDVNGYYGSRTEDPANVFLGPSAGNTTMIGSGNTGIGFEALGGNTEGNFNTATGDDALANNNTGAFNTASGFVALLKNNGGSGNTAIGVSALFNNTIGFENIAVGHAAGVNLTTGDSNIDIGNPGVAGDSETIRIGAAGTHTQAFLAGVRGVTTGVNDAVAVMIDSAGQLGTLSSSRRFKRNIEDMGDASQGLTKLRPVTFRYSASLDPAGPPQYGLIAEEVAEVFPDLVVFDSGGQPETVRYHFLVPMLLNEVQKDRKTIADLTARLERLEALMAESTR